MSCSMSPARRKRSLPNVPSRTIDTLLMPVPVSVGSGGTRSASGHSTRKPMSSSRNRAPVDSRDDVRPLIASAAANAP